MTLDLPSILVILAAAQGLLLALLILQKHRALFANRYLALLMLSYTFVLVHLVLQDSGTYQRIPYLFLISGCSLASMPLHYLYTRHLIYRSRHFRAQELLHFLPFTAYETVLLLFIAGDRIDFSLAGMVSATEVPVILRIYNIAVIILGAAYLGASLRLIAHYTSRVKEVVSTIEPVQLTWLRDITRAGVAAVSFFLMEELFLFYGINLTNFILSSVGFALYVYGMGYMGLLKSEIFAAPAVERTIQTVEAMEQQGAEHDLEPRGKYERSGLSAAAAEQIHRDVLTAMEERKLYRNSALTLTELADTLGVSPHNLSEVINTALGKNFYDLVNGYRLEETKRHLADPAKAHLKILSVAFDAGFNSKATFNTLFKEATGKTPSEFRASVLPSLRESPQ